MIRKATPGDIEAVVSLAEEAVSIDPIDVKIDRDAMAKMARQCLQPAHYLKVDEYNGEIVAAVAAVAEKSFWFRGLQCSVLLHYSKRHGSWAKLMMDLGDWIKGRSGIKVAVVEMEPHHDEKMERFLGRVGFDRKSRNMTYLR